MNDKARISRLPVLQYCGQSQVIGERVSGKRSAAVGTAFHAKIAGDPKFQELYDRLQASEQDDVDNLVTPTMVSPADGIELTVDNAHKEVAVGLLENGVYCDYSDASAVVRGTCDLHWVVELNGAICLYVADMKRTHYAEPDGPHSLQIKGYALALCSKYGAAGYVTGLWDATQGEWSWASYVDSFSEDAERDLAAVVAAAKNHGGEFSMGGHCARCYGRSRCPQWLLPPDVANTILAPLTTHEGLTQEKALELLQLAKRAADTSEAVIDILKHYARENGGIFDPTTEKTYGPTQCKGRMGFNKSQFEKDDPKAFQRYVKFGAPFERFDWKKG